MVSLPPQATENARNATARIRHLAILVLILGTIVLRCLYGIVDDLEATWAFILLFFLQTFNFLVVRVDLRRVVLLTRRKSYANPFGYAFADSPAVCIFHYVFEMARFMRSIAVLKTFLLLRCPKVSELSVKTALPIADR